MKSLLSILVAVLLAAAGMTAVFAEEVPESEQSVIGYEAEENGEDQTRPDELIESESTESKPKTIKGNFKSEDGNYKLYIYDNGELAYADIIKYIGKDKLPESYKITKIDGYRIRQIRSKAFSNLKSLRKVTFKGTIFSEKHHSTVCKDAFYNCKKMTSFSTSSFVTMKKKCVGYVDDKVSPKFKTLTINDKTLTKEDVSSKLKYADDLGAKAVLNISKNNTDNRQAKLVDYLNGTSFQAKLGGKTVKGWKSSNPKVISVTAKGRATILTKGKATLSVKSGKTKYKRVISVPKDPYLTLKGKSVKSVEIKNGKTLSVKVVGKAAEVDNVYTDTGYAEFDSEPDATTLKVRATRRGSTTLKVSVNGKKLKLKVKILKNPIKAETMEKIAARIGQQDDFYYDDARVMCSAYAYAYTYLQVTGRKITPGSVWCPGGCTWAGGINKYYGTRKNMMKAIKKSLDKNEACVGLLAIGNSNHHYVTFYDYEGKGTDLDDFKILDPWAGNLTTGENYYYSYDYQVITVDNN